MGRSSMSFTMWVTYRNITDIYIKAPVTTHFRLRRHMFPASNFVVVEFLSQTICHFRQALTDNLGKYSHRRFAAADLLSQAICGCRFALTSDLRVNFCSKNVLGVDELETHFFWNLTWKWGVSCARLNSSEKINIDRPEKSSGHGF